MVERLYGERIMHGGIMHGGNWVWWEGGRGDGLGVL